MTTTTLPPRALRPENPRNIPTKARLGWPAIACLYVLGVLALVNAIDTTVGILITGKGDYAETLRGYIDAYLHLIPGGLFLILGPLQLSNGVRVRWPRFHKVSGRIFVLAGLFAAISALYLSTSTLAYGGYSLFSANVTFGTLLAVSLVLGLRGAVTGKLKSHRAWMIRAFALGLVAGTSRLYILPQFLLWGEPDLRTMGPMMWAMWLSHLVIAELFFIRPRRPGLVAGEAQSPR